MIPISVALGTYNGADYLREQLDSLAGQSHLPFELQVGDDGSTDATLSILSDFAQRAPFPVTIVRNPRRLGFGENFMQTAQRCSGDWIAFCDQDDVWLPEKLKRCAEVIAGEGDDLLMVAHNATAVTKSLQPIGPVVEQLTETFPQLTLPPDWFAHGFRQVFRRLPINAVPYEGRNLRWSSPWEDAHDRWTCLLANVLGRVALLDDPLVLYRRHGAAATRLESAPRELPARLLAALQDNSGDYEKQAMVCRQVAEALDAIAAAKGVEQLTFCESAVQVRAYAERLTDRARIYQAPRLKQRLTAWRQLRATGAYGGAVRWPFERKGELKDGLAALGVRLRVNGGAA